MAKKKKGKKVAGGNNHANQTGPPPKTNDQVASEQTKESPPPEQPVIADSDSNKYVTVETPPRLAEQANCCDIFKDGIARVGSGTTSPTTTTTTTTKAKKIDLGSSNEGKSTDKGSDNRNEDGIQKESEASEGDKQKEEEPSNVLPQKNDSCCASNQNKMDKPQVEQVSPSEEKSPKDTTEEPKIAPKLSPKSGGSCCTSKKKAPATASNSTCCGCGDNCQCCIENGWSYCQCGPNCRCSNPLLTEQASLVLECTGQKPSPTDSFSGGKSNFNSSFVEDPLKSLSDPSPDIEANHQTEPKRSIFVDIVVGGMTCTMCSQAITRAVSGVTGIQSVTVSLSTDVAHVEMDPSRENEYDSLVEEIQEMISDIGYMVVDVIPMPNRKLAQSATAGDVLNDSQSMSNPVGDTQLNITTEENASNNGDNSTQQDRWNRIAQRQEEKLQQRKQAFLWSLVGTVPILLLTMILPHMVPHSSGIIHWWERQHIHVLNRNISVESLLLWLLATPVQFICGWEFYKSSYYGLFRTGTLGMDVLVVLGTTASYGYALFATLSNQSQESHFFETSAVLICFVLLGKWMQALAVHRTSDALSHLMQLQPSSAIRVVPIDENAAGSNWDPMKEPYREEEVPTRQLQRGDIVKVVPGASLPADGVVLAGELAVDESMVTGESLPVLKTKSSVVLGGTVCVDSSGLDESGPMSSKEKDDNGGTVKSGRVAFCRVTGVGSSTALAQIIQLVQDAQASKVPMQNFADTVSSIFVPVVAALSVITFLVWYALCSSGVVPEEWYTRMDEDAATFSLMFAIACLVISCPCALGLATPTAVMVGTGMGAKLGILMKGGEALEAASQVNAVVLDKTGTVTTGKPVVTDFVLLDQTRAATASCCSNRKKLAPTYVDGKPLSRETILWLLGSLERSSEHPLAKAIVAYAEKELSQKKKGVSYLERKPFLQPGDFRSMTGRGASGYMPADKNNENRHFVAVGNRAFFAALEVDLTTAIDDQMKQLEEQGKTAILAAVNYQFHVILGVADELKADAAASVAYLRNEMNIEVWMVTGDNARTAQAIARQLNLPPQQVVSEALPNAKVHQVKKLQQQGKIVAHVGDGINDSPALAQANVGISMGTGAAIAAEASDVVLVKGQHVADVCIALDLCRVIFARMKWNMLWSLIYNCLGIPLAAGVCFPFFHTRLPPTVAALAMALSSVSVVFSSLALRLYRPPVVDSPVRLHARSSARNSAAIPTSGNQSQETRSVPPRRNRPQLVTSLSLDVGASSSSELVQPLLANDHLPGSSADGQRVAAMEEGRPV